MHVYITPEKAVAHVPFARYGERRDRHLRMARERSGACNLSTAYLYLAIYLSIFMYI